MPDGAENVGKLEGGALPVPSLRVRADDISKRLRRHLTVLQDLLATARLPGAGTSLVNEVITHLACSAADIAEGSSVFNHVAENPSAFRRSARAGLADVWALRISWDRMASELKSAAADCRAAMKDIVGEGLAAERATEAETTNSDWTGIGTSSWMEFLCLAVRQSARGRACHPEASSLMRNDNQGGQELLQSLSDRREPSEEVLKRIATSSLFDVRYYLSNFGPDERLPENPIHHFAVRGWCEGKSPHPLFSTNFYLARLTKALEGGLDPLSHYILLGSAEKMDTHPLFSTAFFSAHTANVPANGSTWLGHFLKGEAGHQSPHPLFDHAYYSAHAGLSEVSSAYALVHYLIRGSRYQIPCSPLLSREFYNSQWQTQPDQEPCSHYLLAGASLDVDPHPLFDSKHYRRQVSEAHVANPLLHYLTEGEARGLTPSPFFDPAYYRATYNADMPLAGSLASFLSSGAQRDHNPIACFRSAEYRAVFMRSDSAAAEQSAIEHFLTIGLTEFEPAKFASLLDMRGQVEKVKSVQKELQRTEVVLKRCPRLVSTEAPAPRGDKRLMIKLKFKDYPGKLVYRPGAPHILLVAHVAGEHLFGSERSFMDMVEAIEALPANVYVALPRNVPDYTNAIRAKVHYVSVFSYPWWRDRAQEDEEVVLLFRDLISSLRIDAVHVNTIMLREALSAARRCGVPGVTHVRELINADPTLTDLIGEDSEAIISEVCRRSDWIIGNSEITARIFNKPGSTFFIPNTIDLARIDVPRSSDSRGKVRFGLISSNIPKKGLADVVELARLATKSCPSAEFVLIGPETEAVREIRSGQAARMAPTNVLFPGYAPSPSEALRSLDVVLNFSHFAESFGRTILEAMGSGRPVIAYDWGALPELVLHGVTGYLVPYRQPESALKYIEEFCAHPDRIASLGDRARDIARSRYGSDSYGKRFRSVYKQILSVHADRPDVTVGPVVRPARRTALKVVEQKGRIAYFCWHFPVPSETFVLNELEVLVAEGVDVLVFCRQSPHKDFRPSFPITWERTESVDVLAHRLKETGRTMVHAHFTYPTVTNMVLPACEKAGLPFTFIAHAQDIFKYENDRQNCLDAITSSPLCVKVFTLSRFHYDFLAARGVPREKIVINPNAVNTERFRDVGHNHVETRPFRRIIAVHRYVAKKGLSLLIAAAALIRDIDVTIDIFGYGDLENEYRRQINDLGVTNVTLKGRLTQDQVLREMREADLFACPSIRTQDGDMDGIPTSIVESMAAGVPVLATAIAGIPDLVADGLTGIMCEPNAEDVASAIRRFYAMSDERVASMIRNARARASGQHDARRLVRVLRRVWENRTVDIVIVSWNNLEHLRAVIERVRLNTALPYHLIICDNQSRKEPVPQYLDALWEDADNVTVIHNDINAMVGPGTNAAVAKGVSDVIIYLCGKEGFSFANGWELPFIHAFAEDEGAGLVGTLGRSPTYLTGNMYQTGIPLFTKFRNREFASANKDRTFAHVQGGLFGIRRSMMDAIGGFSTDVPHDYTDVEYSYYVESCGWKLVQTPGVLALFNKSRPTLSQRFDESIVVAHPVELNQIATFDALRAGRLRHCNICDWYGGSFTEQDECPSCSSQPRDRTIFRWLSDGPYMYRRLPAVAIGISGRLEKVWAEQFQGPRLTTASFLRTLREEGRLKNADAALRVALLRDLEMSQEQLASVTQEISRVMKPGAPILFQFGGLSCRSEMEKAVVAAMKQAGFAARVPVRYMSAAVRFEDSAVLMFERAREKFV